MWTCLCDSHNYVNYLDRGLGNIILFSLRIAFPSLVPFRWDWTAGNTRSCHLKTNRLEILVQFLLSICLPSSNISESGPIWSLFLTLVLYLYIDLPKYIENARSFYQGWAKDFTAIHMHGVQLKYGHAYIEWWGSKDSTGFILWNVLSMYTTQFLHASSISPLLLLLL